MWHCHNVLTSDPAKGKTAYCSNQPNTLLVPVTGRGSKVKLVRLALYTAHCYVQYNTVHLQHS